jgi:hypothetical protein
VPLHFTNRGCQSSPYGIFEQIITSRLSKWRISIIRIVFWLATPPY